MIKGASWLAMFIHAALVALVLFSRQTSAIEVRDPLEYDSILSAPVGVDPLEGRGIPSGRVPRRYIVRLKEDVQDLEAAISTLLVNTTVTTSLDSAAGIQIASSAEPAIAVASLAAVGAKPRNTYSGGGMQGFVLDLPDQVNEDEVVNKLVAQQDVMRVVPDTWVGIAAATVRLPAGGEATNSLLRIKAILPPRFRSALGARPMAQANSKGTVNVALIDTGCDITNKDLNIVGGVDFTTDNSYGLDGNGHGTHVAGILGSKANGRGIVGMYPNVGIYCLKVLGSSGQGTMGTVVTALTWVAQNGRANKIRVVNLSLSGEPNREVCDAITAVTRQGITVVAAAGNNGKDIANFSPGNCQNVLVVTAMTDFDGLPGGLKGLDAKSGEVDDTPAHFSNYAGRGRPSNLIAAPGVRILSSLPAYRCLDASSPCVPDTDNLAYLSGTSMATPIVSAQLAMCYEKGTCKSETTHELARVVRQASNFTRNSKDYGYNGDPINTPIPGKYYGFLVYGNAF